MLNSRSTASKSKFWLLLIVALTVMGVATRHAHAEGRKRVVVLPFDGDEKAEKFHAAVIKLIKKSHTVVSTDKWESTAENLSASKVNEKNIQKVAKKLKVDGVIEGTISKRRDEYIIKLKLHAGSTGKEAGKVDTKAEGTKLEGGASKDIKDELITAIDDLKSVRGGGDGDDEEKPSKTKKDDDEEKPSKTKKDDEEKPSKTKKDDEKTKKDDEEKPTKSKFGKKKDDEAKKDDDEKPSKTKKDDEEKPSKTKKDDEEAKKDDEKKDDEKPEKTKKGKKGKKDVAAKDKDGETTDDDVSVSAGAKITGVAAVSPGNRAIEATVGASFNARRLSWKADGDLATGSGVPPGMGRPHNYNGVPAPGAVVDITAYPMAFAHKTNGGQLANVGLNVYYDKALLISSQLGNGTKLKTAAQELSIGALYRYPLGSLVVGGGLAFGSKKFQIEAGSDLPNVNYSMIEPSAFLKVPLGKLTANVDLGYQLVSKTGQMTAGDQYGKAKVSGLDVELGVDYSINKALFARGALAIDKIGYKFDGSGTLATGRDGDMDQDVQGATDLYIGAMVTIGYLY